VRCGHVELANWSWDRVDGEFSTGCIRRSTFHSLGLIHSGRFYVAGFVE